MSVGLLTKGMISPPSTTSTTIGEFLLDTVTVAFEQEIEVGVELAGDIDS